MDKCKNIRELISLLVAQEASIMEVELIESHIKECAACKKEFEQVSLLSAVTAKHAEKAESMVADIDFAQIMRNEIKKNKYSENKRKSTILGTQIFSLKPIVSFAAVFVFGILTGYFFFINMLPEAKNKIQNVNSISLARVEVLNAKGQVKDFLKKSQLVLTDMMRDGEYDKFSYKRAGALLRKSRYFKSSLNSVELMSSKKILEKISWILYEISAMDKENYVKEMNRLQLLIEKERLLMKIRLVEKELDLDESNDFSKEMRL